MRLLLLSPSPTPLLCVLTVVFLPNVPLFCFSASFPSSVIEMKRVEVDPQDVKNCTKVGRGGGDQCEEKVKRWWW